MIFLQAILFDLDGVLVDACEWHYEALNESLQEVVGFKISRKDHLSKYNGLPTKIKLNILGLNQNDQDKVWKLKQEKTLEIISKSTKQDNEKIILLEYLKKQNIKIGCVTNSIKITASKMLEVSNLLPYIDLLVTNENVENNKPFPDCYNYAVHKLCVSPDMVMCVEDSNTGIKAAKNSVCKYLWIVKDPTEVTLNNYNLRVNNL